MTQPTEAASKLMDKTNHFQIGERGSSVTDPTDLATSITAIKALIDRMENHGLIADG